MLNPNPSATRTIPPDNALSPPLRINYQRCRGGVCRSSYQRRGGRSYAVKNPVNSNRDTTHWDHHRYMKAEGKGQHSRQYKTKPRRTGQPVLSFRGSFHNFKNWGPHSSALLATILLPNSQDGAGRGRAVLRRYGGHSVWNRNCSNHADMTEAAKQLRHANEQVAIAGTYLGRGRAQPGAQGL